MLPLVARATLKSLSIVLGFSACHSPPKWTAETTLFDGLPLLEIEHIARFAENPTDRRVAILRLASWAEGLPSTVTVGFRTFDYSDELIERHRYAQTSPRIAWVATILSDAMHDEDDEVSICAVEAIQRIGPPAISCEPALILTCHSSRLGVATRAAECLRDISGRRQLCVDVCTRIAATFKTGYAKPQQVESALRIIHSTMHRGDRLTVCSKIMKAIESDPDATIQSRDLAKEILAKLDEIGTRLPPMGTRRDHDNR
jgi:hypothetical protein